MIGGPVVENIIAAGTAGGIFAAFKAWRPALFWQKEVRERRRKAKWRRKIYSFGRHKRRGLAPGERIRDTSR